MNVLAIVNTPLQLIYVYIIQKKLFEEKIDVIISNQIHSAEVLVENAKKSNVFRDVIAVNNSKFSRYEGEYKDPIQLLKFNRLKIEKQGNELWESLDIDKKYDVLLISNTDRFADLAYKKLIKGVPCLKVYMFEDGYATYSLRGGNAIISVREYYKSMVNRCLSWLRGDNKRVARFIDKQILMFPERIEWASEFTRVKLPNINFFDENIKQELNVIFGYDEEVRKEYENASLIFFEESFRRDSYLVNDVLLVEMIASWIGRDNIVVKLHPRSQDNLYENFGYKVAKNTTIPWEIVMINNRDFANKILVSISSSCILDLGDLIGFDCKVVVLKKLLYGSISEGHDIYYKWLDKYVIERNPEIFFQPNSLQELKEYIKESN